MNSMNAINEAPTNEYKRKALVVDDNSLLVYFTAKNLERDVEDLQVLTALSCQEARIQAAEHHPSVLIVDYGLEDGNGLDLIAELSLNQPGVEAILISGQEVPGVESANVFASVRKPYEARMLADIVKDALEHSRPVSKVEKVQGIVSCAGYDRHRVENHLGSLLAGLRAFGKEVQARAHEPEEVIALSDEYLDRLCSLVLDVSRLLPSCPPHLKNRGDT